MPSLRPRAMLMRGEVERQADQAVAQRVGDELVELVADLPRSCPHDGAGGLGALTVPSPLSSWSLNADRVEERVEQADVVAAVPSATGARSTVSVSIEWPKR